MQEIFADTAHWIAPQLPEDELHESAIDSLDFVSTSKIVTSELVLSEFLNHFSGRGVRAREIAANTWKQLHANPMVTVVPSTNDLLQRAVERYSKHRDKEWSLTDCTSFEIMNDRKIDDALTADHHFEQAGFRTRLKPANSRK